MSHTGRTTRRLDTGAAALWASALVILAMLITQAGQRWAESAAQASDVATIGDLTILTADSGDNEDILAILDRRNETLFVYGVRNRQSVELFDSYDMSRVFMDARVAAGLAPAP